MAAKRRVTKRARTRAVPAHSQRRLQGDAVLERLRREILLGKRKPGTRLPPERELAEKMSTNRNTLREALRILEREQLIRSRQGDGTMVRDWRQEAELSLLPSFLKEDTPPAERFAALGTLMVLRDQMLSVGARRAADQHTEQDLANLLSAIAALSDPSADAAELIRRDIAFYRCLVMATHDVVLTWSFNTFAKVFAQLGELFPAMWPIEEVYLLGLTELIARIRRRDGEGAVTQLTTVLNERSFAVAQRLPYP